MMVSIILINNLVFNLSLNYLLFERDLKLMICVIYMLQFICLFYIYIYENETCLFSFLQKVKNTKGCIGL